VARGGLRLALLAVAAVLTPAAPALAAPSVPAGSQQALVRAAVPSASPPGSLASPYGEVTRFGGFDATGSTPGKFVLPVGFAVDPGDSNAVYVLDRTVDNPVAGELAYRLQKISSTGTHQVLGSTTFKESYTDKEFFTDAHPLISLAVDSSTHRVYALVENVAEINGEEEYVPIAAKLVAWSTVPSSGKLVAAPGYPVDPLTGGGLVIENLNSTEASKDLYAPEGLTVDPHNHDVVIEAQQGVKAHRIGGPTILQRVGTQGSSSGKLDGSWVADLTTAPDNQQGDGLFTATNGSFGIDLYEGYGSISRLADVSANFSTPSASPIAPDTSGGANRDEAPTIDNRATVNYNSNNGGQEGPKDLGPYTAGSPVVQLSNEVYAARFAQLDAGLTDPQSVVEPWNGLPDFWFQGNEATKFVAHEGIRLFTSNGTVLTTIGGQAQGQACNLDFAQLAVAAGANGTVFALTQPNEENGNTDDQVIEFAPGGKDACPQPSGSLTLDGQSGSSFSFPVGTNVTFADAVERKGEAPYRFDWVLFNSSSLEDLKTQIEGPEYKWPAPSTSHTFTKAGTYYVTATVYGDYGLTYITTDTIKIH
jgi:hypothetical protein